MFLVKKVIICRYLIFTYMKCAFPGTMFIKSVPGTFFAYNNILISMKKKLVLNLSTFLLAKKRSKKATFLQCKSKVPDFKAIQLSCSLTYDWMKRL